MKLFSDTNASANLIQSIILIPITIASLLLFVYAFAPVIDTVFGLWNMLDTSNQFYSQSLHNNVIASFSAWHTLVLITGAMAFVYVAVQVYRKQRYHEAGDFEEYYDR